MTDCEAIQERMPRVARGLDAWSPAEAQHLVGCAECAAEWRLVQAGASLHATTAIDMNLITDRVTARLRTEPVAAAPIRRLPWRGGLIGVLGVCTVKDRVATAELPAPSVAWTRKV